MFDTVLMAIGRRPLTEELKAEEVGLELHPRSKKFVSDNEETNIPNIFAVGDVLEVIWFCAFKSLEEELWGRI